MNESEKSNKKSDNDKIFKTVLIVALFLVFFPVVQLAFIDDGGFSAFAIIPAILLSGCIIFPLTIMRMKEGGVNLCFKILGYAAIFFYFFMPVALLASTGQIESLVFLHAEVLLSISMLYIIILLRLIDFGAGLGFFFIGMSNFNSSSDGLDVIVLSLSYMSAFVGIFCFIIFKIYALIVGFNTFEDPRERKLTLGFIFPIWYYAFWEDYTKNTK